MGDRRPLNVFVVGAGASTHVGLPLAGEVLRKVFVPCMMVPSPQLHIKHLEAVARGVGPELKAEILSALQRFRNGDPSLPPGLTLQGIVTAVERQDDPDARKALYQVVFGMFDELAKLYSSAAYEWAGDRFIKTTGRNCYDTLVEDVMPLQERNGFISFNYDLFLDDAVSMNAHDILGDYGLSFGEVLSFEAYKRILDGKRKAQDVDLLKLHGSFNWGWCRRCKVCVLGADSGEDSREITKSHCGRCGGLLEPILVPPSWDKGRHLARLRPVWERAGNLLSQADRLWVIGYSFSDVDKEALALFRQGLATNDRLREVVIADHRPREICRKVEELAGLTNRQCTVRCYCSFETMCERLAKS